MRPLPSVVDADDYRDFLRAYYLARKENEPAFSYAVFARLAGLNSPNYMKLIIDGERNLTTTSLHAVARALQMTLAEHREFETLVLFNQAASDDERAFYESRLRELRARRRPRVVRAASSAVLLSEWFVPAFLLALHGRRAGSASEERRLLARLSAGLGIDVARLVEVFARLEREGQLSRKGGRLEVSFGQSLHQDARKQNAAHRRYLGAQIERSRAAFASLTAADARFMSHTFTISRKNFDYWAARVFSALGGFVKDSEDEPAEDVVQLNIQLFRVLGGATAEDA